MKPKKKRDEMVPAGVPGAYRPRREVQRVNVDFTLDLLHTIDRAANRIGVTRQAFIKMRLADSFHGLVTSDQD
jgi:hypothetical protein